MSSPTATSLLSSIAPLPLSASERQRALRAALFELERVTRHALAAPEPPPREAHPAPMNRDVPIVTWSLTSD